MLCVVCFFFFKQKTAYEMRISDWSSDVCSSDLDRLKLRASSARCARACFGAEDFTARCLQPGNLDVEILVDGADAGVADAGHGQIRHIRVALPSYSNIGDGTTLL